MKKYLAGVSVALAAMVFGGCAQDCPAPKAPPMQAHYQFSHIVNKMANDLINCKAVQKNKNLPFVLTSFVNLNNFKETSNFGRMISETLMTELVKKGVKVIDYRGQNAITVKKRNGEFFLSRAASQLKPQVKNAYIIVGTYTAYGNSIVVNARLMNNQTGEVVSASDMMIEDPFLLREVCADGLCKKTLKNPPKVPTIHIKKDICDESGPCD